MTAAAERAWEEWWKPLSWHIGEATARSIFNSGWAAAVKAAREACQRVERGVSPNKAEIGASLCADAVGRLA